MSQARAIRTGLLFFFGLFTKKNALDFLEQSFFCFDLKNEDSEAI
jgi:hypothetical protein